MVKVCFFLFAILSTFGVSPNASAYYEESLRSPSAGSAPQMEIMEPSSQGGAEPTRVAVREKALADSAETYPTVQSSNVPHVSQIGTGKLSEVSSRGNKVPLRYALPLLLPRGWSHQVAAKLNDKKVSWYAKSSWLSTLSSMCSQTGGTAVVDWQQRRVEMNEGAPAQSPPVTVTPDEAVRDTGGVPTMKHRVRKSGTAAQVAKRNKISVADFCRWNDAMSDQKLSVGRMVYLSAPREPQRIPSSAPVTSAMAKSSPAPAISTPMPVTAPAPVVTTPPIAQKTTTLSMPEQSGTTPLPVENIHEYEPAPVVEAWSIQPGGLRIQIHGWAARAGYQLVWKAQNDFDMEASANFEGEFLKAVETLFAGMQRAGYALRVTVHQGNKVLEVTEN